MVWWRLDGALGVLFVWSRGCVVCFDEMLLVW